MKKNRFLKKTGSLILAIVLLVCMVKPAPARAATFSDINAPSVFMKQPIGSVTCTLFANAMMLRRAAIMHGDADWTAITPDAMKSTCWVSGSGMRWGYTYKGYEVAQAALPTGEAAKKQYLIEFLATHPEGVALFDQHKPHAVLLTDYTNGKFYYADPGNSIGPGRLEMTSSASVTIASGDRFWYLKSPSLQLEKPDLLVVESPVTDSVLTGNSVKVKGWSISTKGITSVKCTVNDRLSFDSVLSKREDITALNPGYPKGNEGYICDIPFYAFVQGSNSIKVEAYSNDTVIGESTILINYEYEKKKTCYSIEYELWQNHDVTDTESITYTWYNHNGELTVKNREEVNLPSDKVYFDFRVTKDHLYEIVPRNTNLTVNVTGDKDEGFGVELTDKQDLDTNKYHIINTEDGLYIVTQEGYYLTFNQQNCKLEVALGTGAANQRWSNTWADPTYYESGDVNRDCSIDVSDVISMKKHLVGLETQFHTESADVDANQIIDITDVIELMKYLVGLDSVVDKT